MRTDKQIKKYMDVLGDISTVNKIAFISYIVCAVIYALLGFDIFYCKEFEGALWQPPMYYILLLLPILLTAIDYSENRRAAELRYSLYLPAIFFYGYMLLFHGNHMQIMFAVYMIGMSVIFCDIRFSGLLSLIFVFMNICNCILRFNSMDGLNGARWLHAGLVFAVAFFFNFSIGIVVIARDAKLADVNEEKQRFKALASVDGKLIFEYDIAKDEFTLIKNIDKRGEERICYKNISQEAKLQRFVLYADWEQLDDFFACSRAGKSIFDVQLRLRNQNADYLWYQFKARTVYDKDGNPISILGTMENIDDRKRMELRIADENMRDSLTKLYERDHAKNLIENFLAQPEHKEYAGLLIIDVDNFSGLIEKIGGTVADEVLKSMAADLDEIFYSSDILGRVGGDAFVVLMKNIRRIPDIEKKMQEIQSAVHKTYTEAEMNFTSTVTIGASVFPMDGSNYEELYRNAEKALVYEKQQGKNRYGFYDPQLEEEYKKLHIEETHNKIVQKHEIEQMYERKETDSLTELAFRLIDESKDTDSAINLLLRQVTRKLGLDAICVRHRVGREYKMVYPYRCILGDYLKEEKPEIVLPKEYWEKGLKRIKESNGYISCDDTSKLEDDFLREDCKKHGIRAYARCSYFEKDEYIGSIDFVSCSDVRVWSSEDKKTIQAVTNVISSYLLKMKAYEDASDMIERLTGYDAVTGFYKYEKFLDLAEEYFKTAPHGRYVIAYLDFSNFKYINEMYGYEVGDRILQSFAETVMSYDERFIMGSRVFSDNIICLLHADDWDDAEMLQVLEERSRAFREKIQREYFESNVRCIIGLFPFEVNGGEILLKNIISNANLARKEAKKPEQPDCVIYSEAMGNSLQKEIEYSNDMENAFRNKEFVVYIQPKIDLKKHCIIGAEALIRWIKQDGRMIYPNEFIPVFEKNKKITLLDYFVYDEVCKYLANRIKLGERIVSVSMNVSRVHLQSIDEMVSYVRNLLKRYAVPPEYLEFELTETISTEKVEDAIELLTKLRELGVKVSMDDFGSGYSSLNILTKLPLDVVKLDKEFLKDFDTDSDEKIIIPSIIDMAKKLRLEVVCEGVETKQQVEFLRKVDCDMVQGFYYSKPVPLDVFSAMLADRDFVILQENRLEESAG